MKAYIVCLLLAFAQAANVPEQFVSNSELLDVSEELYSLDENRVADGDVVVNPSGTKFFTSVREDKLTGPTFSKLIRIIDSYHPSIGIAEEDTAESRRMERDFLDEAMKTPVMQKLWQFLQTKKLASNTEAGFKNELYSYWFEKYSRSTNRILDSSGFEHVFAGELKNNEVGGFHNWVQFYRQEKSNKLHYNSYIQGCEPGLHVTRFHWLNVYKRIGSMFVGTSPEYDLSVFTLCFLTRAGGKCYISMDGNERSITTYTMANVYPKAVGTSYPDC